MNKKIILSFFVGGIAGFIAGLMVMLLAFPFLFPTQSGPVDTQLQQALQQPAAANEEVVMQIGTKPTETVPVEQNNDPAVVSGATEEPVQETGPQALLTGSFDPNAKDSDTFHRGEGDVQIVTFNGKTSVVFNDNVDLTPGPDYQLYLVPQKGVETEDLFNQIKSISHNVGSVKTFEGFSSYTVPETVDLDDVKGVVVWCESFGQFISYADLS